MGGCGRCVWVWESQCEPDTWDLQTLLVSGRLYFFIILCLTEKYGSAYANSFPFYMYTLKIRLRKRSLSDLLGSVRATEKPALALCGLSRPLIYGGWAPSVAR